MPSRKRRRPLQKPTATINRLATVTASAKTVVNAGQDAIDRVKKCFERANHENANENEAKAASKMASKIMERYQISQADIMVNETSSEREKRGGISIVDVRPAKNGGRAFIAGWTDELGGAMQNFFDCRCFTSHRTGGGYDRIEWTFYGIAEHTVSAAIAFEAVYNQIQHWSEEFIGIPERNSYCLGVADGLLKLSKDEREEQQRLAREAEEKALAAKIREEDAKEQERHLAHDFGIELDGDAAMDIDNSDAESTDSKSTTITNNAKDTLDTAKSSANCKDTGNSNNHTIEAEGGTVSDTEILPDYAEQDEDEMMVDPKGDFDKEVRKFTPSEPANTNNGELDPRTCINNSIVIEPAAEEHDSEEHDSEEDESEEDDSEEDNSESETVAWKSARQLSTYQEMSKDVADQVLKEQHIKLSKARLRPKIAKSDEAYKQGQRDSKKIEVRAARIEEGSKDRDKPMAMDV